METGRATARREELAGGAFLLASAVLFGSIVVLGRFTRDSGLPVPGLLSVRFAVAGLLLAALLIAMRRPLLAEPGERVGLFAIGMLGYGVEAMFFFAALRRGEAAPVTMLFYTYPVLVTLLAWALGRGGPNRLTVTALVCGVAGAGIVVAGGRDLSIEGLGVVLALSSAGVYTGYLLGADHVVRRTQPLTGSMWVSVAAAAATGAYAALTGTFRLPGSWDQWWPILAMAVATAAAFVTLFGGLRRMGAVRTAIISSFEPFAAAILAFVFLGETIGVAVGVGGVLIVIGSVLAAVGLGPPKHPEPPPLP